MTTSQPLQRDRRPLRAALHWPYTFSVCLSVVVGITALTMTNLYNVPMRDPEGFLGPAYVRLPAIGLMFFAIGILPQAMYRTGVWPLVQLKGVPRAVREILREDWTWSRVGHIAVGLLSFYICYVSYRNIKSMLPLARDDNFDYELMWLDHFLMFGSYPATFLHETLGTGVVAYVLSWMYLAYLPLIPLSLGALLVWNRDVGLGAWYATALSLNWVLGAVSYYLLPTHGPAFQSPSLFFDLPETDASALQQALFVNGSIFKEDPTGPKIYGIAGFASLHVSVVMTAALFFQRTRQPRWLRIPTWTFLGITITATLYFGWHYIADDIAGLLIGWLAVTIGAWVTGNRRSTKHRDLIDDGPLDDPFDHSTEFDHSAEPERR